MIRTMKKQKEEVPRSRIVLLILNTITLALTLTVNALAVTLPLNGIRTDEISDLYGNLFVPSAQTFSIWGIIYLLLIINQIYQFSVVRSSEKGAIIEHTGILFILVHLANTLWMLSWHYLYIYLTTSFIIMLLLLIALAFLYKRAQETCEELSERMLILFPVSVYLGWIMTATVANATALLTTIIPETYKLYQVQITIGTLIGVVLLYVFVSLHQRDIWIPAVGIWAVYGIYSRQATEGLYPSLTLSSLIGIAVIALAIVVTLVLKGRNASIEDELF